MSLDKAEKKETTSRMIGALLRVPFQATVSQIYEGLTKAGYSDLRPSHFTVFQHLPPEGARLTELAEKAQITKQSMGYLIEYLEECGYIRRVPDPADGRASLILWSEKGKTLEREARRIMLRIEEDWSTYLGEARFQQLRETLKDLVFYLEEQEPKN
ncbi:MAG TPA: MarR family transcriptional regulator [Chloroflexia bacterium]|nr:MarR family transcriptional regulator [Chloroflexia bacterium]